MMSLTRKKHGPMEVVPMNKSAFKKLIGVLEKVSSLHPTFEPYLEKVMVAKYCTRTHELHVVGEVINKAYYISSGYIMAYYFDEEGNVHVLNIFFAGDIVAGYSFMNGVPSRYYLKIFSGTYVLEITNQQMKTGYETIPGMDELARLTLASFEYRELQRNEMINKGAEECVLNFYKEHMDLLPPGKIIKDPHIASYLHMGENNLYRLRAGLIKNGLLTEKRR